jgi:hypothetical protein
MDLSTEFFVIPGMAVATRHPLRGLFRERPCPPGQTHTRAFLDSCRGIKSLALNARDKRRPHELQRCQRKTDPGLLRFQSF